MVDRRRGWIRGLLCGGLQERADKREAGGEYRGPERLGMQIAMEWTMIVVGGALV